MFKEISLILSEIVLKYIQILKTERAQVYHHFFHFNSMLASVRSTNLYGF